MAILTKEQILAAPDIRREVVSVPEWGGEVVVTGLTGAERDAFEASIVQLRGTSQRMDMTNLRAKLCALAIKDEAGKRIFSDVEISDLGRKSAQALQRVFEAAQRLSALSPGDVESLTANFTSAQSGASGSA